MLQCLIHKKVRTQKMKRTYQQRMYRILSVIEKRYETQKSCKPTQIFFVLSSVCLLTIPIPRKKKHGTSAPCFQNNTIYPIEIIECNDSLLTLFQCFPALIKCSRIMKAPLPFSSFEIEQNLSAPIEIAKPLAVFGITVMIPCPFLDSF
jgi:hypothetical protein